MPACGAALRGFRQLQREEGLPYPRWTARMCFWMPAAVFSTLPQFFQRHLNITFMEFYGKKKRQHHNASKSIQSPSCLHCSFPSLGKVSARMFWATELVKSWASPDHIHFFIRASSAAYLSHIHSVPGHWAALTAVRLNRGKVLF